MMGSEKIIEADDDIPEGFEKHSEIEKDGFAIRLYVVGGGEDILDECIIAGSHIPVVPVYGERAFVEGEEHYEGITRLAKDPQRLRNFLMSYCADVVSRSPRVKPIYFAEQLQTFEHMFEENGSDNNFPYLLQNRLD